MSAKNAWGRGLATVSDGRILDVWYPELGFGEPAEGAEEEGSVEPDGGSPAGSEEKRGAAK